MARTMRGASADALADLTSILVGKLGGGADASRIGDDLFTVSSLLRSEAALRRVVTDVSVDAPAKKNLVTGLLAGKVDEVSLDLVGEAVSRRWTVSRDLADALETLSEVAVVRSAGTESGRLADELFAFGQAVNDNPGLRDALSDPSRSVEDKSALVRGLLEGKALPATITLATQSLAGTYRTVAAALATYQQVAAEVHGERVATVRVAHPLAEADRQRLADALSRQYGRPIQLNVVIDPEVIGGLRVEIGDDVIDGTVETRLADARRKLAG
ncbi:F0F1 ATP synthase subunit delta [Nocardioides seonyuensis]|uniref:ATP synthase subunit delta n=1 Tax=Nocardioides seonyuensis TaxID=2518371 RepID=A0A4P7IGT3_9ACTN|nr:F0F1 ATP synthase subunit delta [Nocardioides seonyuensis]QBX56506.1 F0F1 ATP synthase subunit delta [Nocardioides seonyuensis]